MEMERKGLEFSVGIFMIVGLICLGYLSFSLGDVGFRKTGYDVIAYFPTVAGLKNKATISMAGVSIGEVRQIRLKDAKAEVVMSIRNDVKLEEDSIATIKTMGIIGDKYISITPGASDNFIKPGGIMRDTQPPLDIEDLISKFVFGSLDSKKPSE